jgi:3,4-dihydroxy-2-butanone 4-phosphate synthase
MTLKSPGMYHPTVKPMRQLSYYVEDTHGEIPRFVVTVSAPDVISGIGRVERELSIAELDRARMMIVYRQSGELPL